MRKRSQLLFAPQLLLLVLLGCTSAQYAPAAPQQAASASASSPPPAIDCVGHSDGLYVRNPDVCNDGFYKCANGRSFYYKCPTGLYFSIEDAQCEYKQLIPACGGQRPTEAPPVVPVAAQSTPPSYQQQPAAPVQPVQPPPATTQAPYQPPPPQTQPPSYQNAPTYASQQPSQQYSQPAPPPVQTNTPPPSPVAPSQPAALPAYQISYAAPPATSIAPTQTQSPPVPVAASQQQPSVAAYNPPAQSAPAYQQQQASVSAYNPPQPAAPQFAATTTQAPVDFNCAGKQSGYYYKQPCTPNYYHCNGGIAVKVACPGGTVFDPLVESCDYPNICGKPRPPTTTTAPVNYGYGWVQPTTAAPSTACQGKMDGFYEKGRCQSAYLHCSNGHAFDLVCPAQTVFRNNSCTYSNDCLFPTTPSPIAVQTPPASTLPPQTWCRDNGKTSGIFTSQACSQKYYVCNGGFTNELTCPASLYYDVTIQQCDERQVIRACGGQPRPPTTTTPFAPRAAVRPPNFNCANKRDGYYVMGCSSTYYSCNGGSVTEQTCPASLVYDVTSQQCEERQFVRACGGQPRPPTTTTPFAPRAAVRPPNFNCASRLDGYYVMGCSSTYYSCNGGSVTEQTCPASLVYDVTSQQCEERQFARSCGGQPRPATTPFAPVAPVQRVNFDCAGKADGYYTTGCTTIYFHCNGGSASQQTCPTGTRYSPQTRACDYPTNIPECGGALPTTTIAAPVAVGSSSSGQYGGSYAQPPQAPTYQQQTTATPPVYQPAPVAPIQPVQPSPATTQAPYQPPPPQTQPPSYQNAPTYTSQQQPSSPATYASQQQVVAPVAAAAAPQTEDAHGENHCEHLQNGIYGKRCLRHYFVCTDHKIFEFTCPSGFAYDRRLARCGPLTGIPGCPTESAPVQTPTAAVQPPTAQPPGFYRVRRHV